MYEYHDNALVSWLVIISFQVDFRAHLARSKEAIGQAWIPLFEVPKDHVPVEVPVPGRPNLSIGKWEVAGL
jgi:hypothetical protein